MTNSSSGGSSSTLYAYKYKSGTRFQVPGKIDQVVELLGCESTRGIYGAKQKKSEKKAREKELAGISNAALKCTRKESYMPA